MGLIMVHLDVESGRMDSFHLALHRDIACLIVVLCEMIVINLQVDTKCALLLDPMTLASPNEI